MHINQDVWNEFITWARVEYRVNPEATVYDVFLRIREAQGNQPFTEKFLETVDGAIAAEDRRNAKNTNV